MRKLLIFLGFCRPPLYLHRKISQIEIAKMNKELKIIAADDKQNQVRGWR